MMEEEDMVWVGGEYRSPKGITVREVVEEWSEGEGKLIFDSELCEKGPEIIWAAVREILQRGMTDDQKALLAAGPLEDLLSFHGDTFIDRVEQEARENTLFNHLVGCVWRNQMPLEVWERVQKIRNEVW